MLDWTTTPRLYVDGDLAEGVDAIGGAAQSHYLGNVRRQGIGGPVRLFNGRDGEFAARISLLKRERVAFGVELRLRPQMFEPDCWLVFALLKRDATDLLVRQATELGVSALLPVFTERTNTARVNAERLAAIATEAAEQSERLTVPELRPARRLADLLGEWPSDRVLAAVIERSITGSMPGGAGGLLVGPEGGFTGGELDALRGLAFIQPVSLGPRVLRAETAAVAGLALLLARD